MYKQQYKFDQQSCKYDMIYIIGVHALSRKNCGWNESCAYLYIFVDTKVFFLACE